jgi:hypothetical protein
MEFHGILSMENSMKNSMENFIPWDFMKNFHEKICQMFIQNP